MAKVICKDCGATGYSKCPHCRTVFPSCQMDAVLSYFLKFKEEKRKVGDTKVTITYIDYINKEEKPDKAFESLLNLLLGMNDPEKRGLPSFADYTCVHNWQFAPGEKSDIDCGHE